MIWVIDDFYPNPDEIRAKALKLNFQEGIDRQTKKRNFPGWRNLRGRESQKEVEWHSNHVFLRNKLQSIVGERVNKFHRSHQAFNLGFAEKNNRFSWVHSDASQLPDEGGTMYALVIYLNPNPVPRSGTILFEHDGSVYDIQKKNRVPSKYYPAIQGNYWDTPLALDPAWKPHTVVSNRYNRCIMYEASMLHAPEDAGFGDTFETARLTQIGFWYGESR